MFNTVAREQVDFVLQGYNSCSFAYGQTGSGKTYTMDGPRNQGAEVRGVVPRAAEQAFACAEQLRSLGCAHLTSPRHPTSPRHRALTHAAPRAALALEPRPHQKPSTLSPAPLV